MSFDRTALLDDTSLVGVEFCRRYAAAIDTWLAELYTEAAGDLGGVTLLARGGYGRSELSPQSDVDVLLLHADKVDVSTVAERLWYPIWDAGLKLGHSVATPSQALSLAAQDLETATSFLDARVLAGDVELGEHLVTLARSSWRNDSNRRLRELAISVEERHRRAGEVAFLLEPDLKLGRGGMRDDHALRWAEAAEPGLLEVSSDTLQSGYEVLLSARVELHRITGRHSDRLLLQFQDDVASAMGIGDADDLMAAIASAARSIAWVSDSTWHRVRHRPRRRRFRRASGASRLQPGIVLEDAMVSLTDEADPTDPALPLQLARQAARHEAFVDHESLERLAAAAPEVPEPWPVELRTLLVDLLRSGHAAIAPIESLDQTGLLVRYVPEWEPCRSRPQRNAYHRFTVDRHLLEAAAEASGLTGRVDRPDLLVVGALLHDIGKGYPGDHTEVGIGLVHTIATRMGFEPPDVAVLVDLVRHHLLVPDAATRRDLDDPGTIETVADQIGSVGTLRLLGALTEADSIATGPSAWGSWKAGLVHTLVDRVAEVLEGAAPDEVVEDVFPDAEQRALLGERRFRFVRQGSRLTVVSPDRPGLFRRVAAVLALNGLDVVEAALHSEDGMALEVYRVADTSGRDVDWHQVETQIRAAIERRLALSARLAERAREYQRRAPLTARPVVPSVTIDNDTSDLATVIEVSCPDDVGVLHRITSAMAEMGLDIVSARVQTLGADVIDAFYVRDGDGAKIVDPAYLAEIERALLDSVGS